MNIEQATHVKSMARHVREHAEALVQRMQIWENGDLSNIPAGLVDENFKEVDFRCKEIKQVMRDMTPRWEELKSE